LKARIALPGSIEKLNILLDVERSLVERSYQVREQLISSSRQELQIEIDMNAHFAKMQLLSHTATHDSQSNPQEMSELLNVVQQLIADHHTTSDVITTPATPNSDPVSALTTRPGHLPPVKSKKRYHAFLTHNWGDASATHERVRQICHALPRNGPEPLVQRRAHERRQRDSGYDVGH